MAKIFKNPHLIDYFVVDKGVDNNNYRSFVKEYEDGKVIYFPNLRPDINFEFWSSIDTDKYPNLKKLSVILKDFPEFKNNSEKAISGLNLESDLKSKIINNINKIFDSILPAYCGIFKEYKFVKCKTVWRLNVTNNENMHIDSYKEKNPYHFARMFINLDNQPRIWKTSLTFKQIFEMRSIDFTNDELINTKDTKFWNEIAVKTFGNSPAEWWDNYPRHVIYFDPGDVWTVDSRQIAHQIFYGRRALSIDFFVEKEDMYDSDFYYLNILKNLRKNELSKRNVIT